MSRISAFFSRENRPALTSTILSVFGIFAIVATASAMQSYQTISTQADELPSQITLFPIKDAYVTDQSNQQNFGNAVELHVDNSPVALSYLAFDLRTLPPMHGMVLEKAVLRLHLQSGASNVKDLRIKNVQAGDWDENTITFKNRPREFEDKYKGMKKNDWVEFDVKSLVSSNLGGYANALLRTNGKGHLIFSSKEGSAKPELVVTYRSLLPTTPTPQSTPIVIASPSPTTEPSVSPSAMPSPSASPQVTPSPLPSPTSVPSGGVRAFPGAEGFGAQTKGGRGGRVIYVTNLNNTGPGSLRAALAASGPRTVVFAVGGTINLQDDITISQPYVTIAAQTAPGDGIQLKGGMVKITTHDVILRYLKVRIGNPTGGNPADTDPVALSAQNGGEVYNVIIDHSSLVWGTDIGGAAVLTNSHDVTIQDSILGEGLNISNHPEAPHSMSLNLTTLDGVKWPTRITVYRNLLTSSDTRNPQIMGGQNIDFVNNVLYNWGSKGSYGNPRSLNFINNYLKAGPVSADIFAWNTRTNPENPSLRNGSVFEQGTQTVGGHILGIRGGSSSIYSGTKFAPYSVGTELTPGGAYSVVLSSVGAVRPVRDAVDTRIVQNAANGTMILPNGATNRLVNAADLVWPNLQSGTAPVDADADGMPDSWEVQHFGNTSRGSATNSSSDYDNDGYTDLEEYLNLTNPLQN